MISSQRYQSQRRFWHWHQSKEHRLSNETDCFSKNEHEIFQEGALFHMMKCFFQSSFQSMHQAQFTFWEWKEVWIKKRFNTFLRWTTQEAQNNTEHSRMTNRIRFRGNWQFFWRCDFQAEERDSSSGFGRTHELQILRYPPLFLPLLPN